MHELTSQNHKDDHLQKGLTNADSSYKFKNKKHEKKHKEIDIQTSENIVDVLDKDETENIVYKSKNRERKFKHLEAEKKRENNLGGLSDEVEMTTDIFYKSRHKNFKKKEKKVNATICENNEDKVPDIVEDIGSQYECNYKEETENHVDTQQASYHNGLSDNNLNISKKSHLFKNKKSKHKSKYLCSIGCENIKEIEPEKDKTLDSFFELRNKESQDINNANFDNQKDFANEDESTLNRHKSKHKKNKNMLKEVEESYCDNIENSDNFFKAKHKKRMKKQVEMAGANCETKESGCLENISSSNVPTVEDCVQNYSDYTQEQTLSDSRKLDYQKKKKHKKRKRDLESSQNSAVSILACAENSENLQAVGDCVQDYSESRNLECHKKHKKRKRDLESSQNSAAGILACAGNSENLQAVEDYVQDHSESRNLDCHKKHKKQKRDLESSQNSAVGILACTGNSEYLQAVEDSVQDSSESKNLDCHKKHKKQKTFLESSQNSAVKALACEENFENRQTVEESVQIYCGYPQEESIPESRNLDCLKRKHKKRNKNFELSQHSAVAALASEEHSENLQSVENCVQNCEYPQEQLLLESRNLNFQKKKHKKRKRDLELSQNLEVPVLASEETSENFQGKDKVYSDLSVHKECCETMSVNPLHSSKSMTDLDFNEDPVDFDIPLLHSNETVYNLKPSQKEELLSQGVQIKQGKFTTAEDETIRENLLNFAEKYHIDDLSDLLGIGRYGKDHKMLNLIKAKHFYVRLGKGLGNRTLQSIYKRARLLFGTYKDSEKSDSLNIGSLKWLNQMFGNKWQKIGTTLGRSADNCCQTVRWHSKEVTKGKWLEEEEQILIEAIKTVTEDLKESDVTVNTIPWEKVATLVPTRNVSQCRWHWAQKLSRQPNSSGGKWRKNHFPELISILKRDWNVTDASEIDWEKVSESFKDVIPSHTYLQKKWLYLKYKVPGYQSMDYNQILNKLCIMYNI